MEEDMVRWMILALALSACGGGSRNDPRCNQTDDCAAGATRCAGNVIETCVAINECTLWQQDADCADSLAVCDASSGTPECVVGCVDQCTSLGATRCQGTLVQQCAQAADGCQDWADGQDCAGTGQSCDDSFSPVQCECDDQCAASDDYCSANTAWHCVESGFGCWSWQTADCATETCYVGDGGATCGEACTAHSRGECGADIACAPQVDAGGLQAWICIELLTDGASAIPTVGAFETCDFDPATDQDTQCAEGHLCQPRNLGDPDGQCRPVCDATGTSPEPGATCPDVGGPLACGAWAGDVGLCAWP